MYLHTIQYDKRLSLLPSYVVIWPLLTPKVLTNQPLPRIPGSMNDASRSVQILYSKPCLKRPRKTEDHKLVFKTVYRLMQVKSIAEHSAKLSTFIKLPFVLKTLFCLFLTGRLRVRCTINRSHSTPCKKAEFEHLQIFPGHCLDFFLPVSG